MTAGMCHDLALKKIVFSLFPFIWHVFEAAAASFVLTRPFHFLFNHFVSFLNSHFTVAL